ncbi:hypothetical protein [Halorussus pelagicus]|uniref:hypothetical protein n=1 Tax=Halorussus pelagicus TaxID=2505977 RepID=UPI00140E0C85|nr:hypothetical protein [Halorussus pelagicus]
MSSKPVPPRSSPLDTGKRSSRPSGVTAICLVEFFGLFVSYTRLLELLESGGFVGILALLGVGFLAAELVVLVCLWNLRFWGYKWGLWVFLLSGLIDIVALAPLALLFDIAIVFYLLSNVEHFE